MGILFVRMNPREKKLGWCYFALLLAQAAFFGTPLPQWLAALNCAGAVYVFRDFLRESSRVPHTSEKSILGYALLGLVLAQLVNLLLNDLIYNFYPRYFYWDLTGPHFKNLLREKLMIQAQGSYLSAAVCTVFLVPIVDELIHRGLIFGTLLRKSPTLAYLLSLTIYGLLHIIPLLGQKPTDYIVLSFIQYIPMCLFFPWVYTQSQTILAPILAHMIMNGVSFFTM